MKNLLIAFVLMAVSAAALAKDHRVIYQRYSPDKVYTVRTTVGMATTLQFASDENLASSPSSLLALGDKAAWTLGVRGNNVTFKPSKKMPNTNLTIVTNKHTYLFDLVDVRKGREIYIMRFIYPKSRAEIEAARDEKIQEFKLKQAAILASHHVKNTAFYWRGDNKALKPTAAFDDGRFTHLIYANAGTLPVFYKVMPDGTEALINYHVSHENKADIVLHDVVPVIRARLNNAVIEIINRGYTVPSINKYNSTERGVVRLNRNEGVQHAK